MGKIILDPALRSKLNGLSEEIEVCDENDETVGIFLPKAQYQKLLYANVKVPFSEAEIEKLRNAGGGCSLAEIWKRLAQS